MLLVQILQLSNIWIPQALRLESQPLYMLSPAVSKIFIASPQTVAVSDVI